jgi:superfamily II DNA helicase RecQ
VAQDVKQILRIEGAEVFRSSINRPNLYYEVRSTPMALELRRASYAPLGCACIC